MASWFGLYKWLIMVFWGRGDSMKFKAKYSFTFLAILLSTFVLGGDTSGQLLTYRDIKCAAEKEQQNVICLQHRAAMLLSGGDVSKERAELAVELIKKALAIDPWHDYAIFTLWKAYLELNDYETALKVLNCIIYKRPWSSNTKYLRCVLMEQMGCGMELARPCYRDVARLLKVNGQTGADYVLAELLAENPNAEEIKKNIYKQIKPGSQDEATWDFFVKDFSREKYLKQMKLVDPKYKKKFNSEVASTVDCAAFMPMPGDDENKKRADEAIAQRKRADFFQTIKWQKLYARALEFVKEKDYNSALVCLDQEFDMGVGANNAALLRCALKEKAGRPEDEYKACYRKLLKAYEAADYTYDPGYVKVGILAYWPDKGYIKKKIMSKFQPGTQAQENWTKYLEVLRRQDLLNEILRY
jgi:tetratricopeptide repeat protein